jgi:hypothetical protein
VVAIVCGLLQSSILCHRERGAIARWPGATIVLRQGARVVHDSRRPHRFSVVAIIIERVPPRYARPPSTPGRHVRLHAEGIVVQAGGLRVEHALKTGQPSELVNSMLDAFEASLRAVQKHRELVLNQLQHRLSGYSH